MNYIKYYLLFGMIMFAGIGTFAQQSSCTFKLEEAERLYETGILDSIPSMLRQCVDDGFDNEELSRAYKLLILTYMFEDYQEMAELTMLKFLKKFPEYELKANDPVEFNYLYKSYKTIPVYSIGIIAGVNYSYVRIIEPYSVDNTEDYKGKYSAAGLGYQAGLQIKRYINEKIEINLDVIYTAKKFNYSLEQLDSKIEFTENQSMLSFPLTATYDFNLNYKNISPYARLGFNLDYLFSASASNLSRKYTEAPVDDITGSDIDILDDRNNLNISGVVGGGLKFHVKKGYVMLDLRYHLGFTNNVNAESRYSNNEKWANYNYIDDDFAMNNLFISIGYVRSFYQTKQKK